MYEINKTLTLKQGRAKYKLFYIKVTNILVAKFANNSKEFSYAYH